MQLTVYRLFGKEDYTGSSFHINGKFACFGIEDEERTSKVYGETRVPECSAEVVLRKEGGFHEKYTKKFNDKKSKDFMGENWHQGMLCITNAPDYVLKACGMIFQYVLIHIGNSDRDSAACYLTVETLDSNVPVGSDAMQGGRSSSAYKKIYPVIRDAILKGEKVMITYIDLDNKNG